MLLESDKALEAVNDMLAVIGEPPVNTLKNTENVDVTIAIQCLERANRQIQSRGWSWNMYDAVLNPDTYTHKIKWNDDILYIVGTDKTKYIRRNDYVYDFDNQKDKFDDSIDVTIVCLVPFEEMPEAVREYIVAKASTRFQAQTLGDDNIAMLCADKEQEAWRALQEYEMDLNEFSMLDLTPIKEIMTR